MDFQSFSNEKSNEKGFGFTLKKYPKWNLFFEKREMIIEGINNQPNKLVGILNFKNHFIIVSILFQITPNKHIHL